MIDARAMPSSAPTGSGGLPERRSGCSDGEWLEHRVLLAATPLSAAVPLHFGLLNDAASRISCRRPPRSISIR